LKSLEDEIRHFRRIVVSLKDISELTAKVATIGHYQDAAAMEKELDDRLDHGK